MTDAPFTETHRATLERLRRAIRESTELLDPRHEDGDAIDAALAEIDRSNKAEELLRRQSRKWNAEADKYLAERDAALDELTALKALLPQIVESLTNDTLLDDPGDLPGPCECEDCGRLRIDALNAVYKLLMSETP